MKKLILIVLIFTLSYSVSETSKEVSTELSGASLAIITSDEGANLNAIYMAMSMFSIGAPIYVVYAPIYSITNDLKNSTKVEKTKTGYVVEKENGEVLIITDEKNKDILKREKRETK